MSVCLSVRPSVYPPSVYLSICLSIYPSIYISKSRYRTNKEVEIAATCCNQLESHSNNRTPPGAQSSGGSLQIHSPSPVVICPSSPFSLRSKWWLLCCSCLLLPYVETLYLLVDDHSPAVLTPPKKVPHVQRDSFRLGFPHALPTTCGFLWMGRCVHVETRNQQCRELVKWHGKCPNFYHPTIGDIVSKKYSTFEVMFNIPKIGHGNQPLTSQDKGCTSYWILSGSFPLIATSNHQQGLTHCKVLTLW